MKMDDDNRGTPHFWKSPNELGDRRGTRQVLRCETYAKGSGVLLIRSMAPMAPVRVQMCASIPGSWEAKIDPVLKTKGVRLGVLHIGDGMI